MAMADQMAKRAMPMHFASPSETVASNVPPSSSELGLLGLLTRQKVVDLSKSHAGTSETREGGLQESEEPEHRVSVLNTEGMRKWEGRSDESEPGDDDRSNASMELVDNGLDKEHQKYSLHTSLASMALTPTAAWTPSTSHSEAFYFDSSRRMSIDSCSVDLPTTEALSLGVRISCVHSQYQAVSVPMFLRTFSMATVPGSAKFSRSSGPCASCS